MDAAELTLPRVAGFHRFERLGRRILFNTETLLAYAADDAAYELAGALTEPAASPEALLAAHGPERLAAAAASLAAEGFLCATPPPLPPKAPRRPPPVTTLELMLTHACNLRCAYCYGREDGAPHLYGADRAGMSLATARRGLDLLFALSGRAGRVAAVFFGGEPLLALDVLEAAAAHGRELEKTTGKRLDLSLSTNATLLDARARRLLARQRIGCQVSLDGPPAVHDACRRTIDGRGSYAAAAANVRALTAMRPGRVPARATLASGVTDVGAVVGHLLGLGFGSVHVEPAAGGCPVSMPPSDVPAVLAANERLAHDLVDSARAGRAVGYENLTRQLRATRQVRRRQQYGCGAGRSLLALSQDGRLYPCHRFVGNERLAMGDAESGPDLAARRRYAALNVDRRPGCADCWARHLCGGGCLHQALKPDGEIGEPDREVACTISLHLIECALALHAELGLVAGRLPGEPAPTQEDHHGRAS